MSTNAIYLDYPLSTSTLLTFVTMMLTVQTPKVLITVHVVKDTLEKGKIAQVKFLE